MLFKFCPHFLLPACRVLYEQFTKAKGDLKSKDNETGIQLMGVVLANKLIPFNSSATVTKDRYVFMHNIDSLL